MSYGPADASRDLQLIREGRAKFEDRARLEHHLLNILRRDGIAAFRAFLAGVPDHEFRPAHDAPPSDQLELISRGDGPRYLVVTACVGEHIASVNVTVADGSQFTATPDPRHETFYEHWESLLGIGDDEAAELDPKQKAVFLVGLLEAEVMNGGLGQYLSNTEGVYLSETVQCLAEIGADKTRALLIEAGKLGTGEESYVAAWASRSAEFERLDELFLNSGEDLALLTVERFFE